MALPDATSPGSGAEWSTCSDPADSEVVREVLGGHTDRFAVLVRRHQDSLFRQARAMGLDADTAADVVQDALVRAFEGLAGWQERSPFRIWLMRILRNRCLDHLKSAPSRRNRPLTPTLPLGAGGPEEEHERSALRNALHEGLQALPVDQRVAFVLRHVEGLSYDEISEVVGASVSALKMRVHRARDALRQALQHAGFVHDVTTGEERSSF